MKIGFWYALVDDGIGLVELGRALEVRGAESLFASEHTNLPVEYDDPMPNEEQTYLHPRVAEPLTVLSVLAGGTTRLVLGTSVLLAAQHEPIVTAKAIATLDTLSGGRLVIGVGPGWHNGELAAHGIDPKRKVSALREHVQAMREIWTKDVAEFAGEHVSFPALSCWPKPVQRPHPPILVGGKLEPAWRKITEYADGWVPVYQGPVEQFVAQIKEMRDRAAAAGRTSLPITIMNPPADEHVLSALAEAGVDRVLLELPRADRDTTLRTLDGHSDLLTRTW